MIVYETTPCEVCVEPLSKGDPGNWWTVNLGNMTVQVALHDEECRREWFMGNTTIRAFRKDKRIEDVI